MAALPLAVLARLLHNLGKAADSGWVAHCGPQNAVHFSDDHRSDAS